MDANLRLFLLIVGWSSIIGTFGDGSLGLYAMYIAAQTDWVEITISVDSFLKSHVEFIYWIKQIAYYVLPQSVVSWLFNLPALIYFPCRVIMSVFIGWWALSYASKLTKQQTVKNM